MLIDRAVIEVRSGKGGNGAISFLHEKSMEFGGPDGGNGGNGGSIILRAENNLSTLFNYRHGKAIIAEDGVKGGKKLMHGRNAEDVISLVPAGTVVIDEATKEVIADLKEAGQSVVVAKGGKGGKGNAMYKSSRNRAPKVGENGYPGERKRIILELKMLADVGLIGFPSVGKSTFLNVVSDADVKTADYPFTTLAPNLGVSELEGHRTMVLADMPGLIDGASEGKGLGLTFLRHIERTKVLIHLVSMDGQTDPYSDYLKIRNELTAYGARLEERPEIVAASKMDAEGALERKAAFDKQLGFTSYPLSSLTHLGVKDILEAAYHLVQITPSFPLKGESEEEGGLRIYDGHKGQKTAFVLLHPKEHYWIISGEEAMKRYAIINTSNEEGETQLIRFLDRIGVDKALKEKGAKNGDTVTIGDFEFIYTE